MSVVGGVICVSVVGSSVCLFRGLLNTQVIIANSFQSKSRIVVSKHCEAMSLKPKVQQNVCHGTI